LNQHKPLPPLEELQSVFEVTEDFPSGLIWKINPSKQGGKRAGSMAGSIPNKGPKYWRVKYKQSFYLCHRIRWSLLNNRLVLPGEYIDHVTQNSEDNRGELRIVTFSQNQYNRKRVKNKSGFRWVVHTKSRPNKPWRVMLKINGKLEYFGYYSNPEEAALKADQIALERLDIDYIHLNFPELKLKNKSEFTNALRDFEG